MKTTRRLRLQEDKNSKINPWSIVIATTLWVVLGTMVYFIDPDMFGVVPVFFILIFGSLFFTIALILKSRRQGFILSSACLIFLILRFFGIGNLLNFLLLGGIVVAIEIYLHPR